jgi:hypothetical protein
LVEGVIRGFGPDAHSDEQVRIIKNSSGYLFLDGPDIDSAPDERNRVPFMKMLQAQSMEQATEPEFWQWWWHLSGAGAARRIAR